jgi:hypothetical protein
VFRPHLEGAFDLTAEGEEDGVNGPPADEGGAASKGRPGQGRAEQLPARAGADRPDRSVNSAFHAAPHVPRPGYTGPIS